MASAEEYERRGTANLFLVYEPLVGQRGRTVTDWRTAIGWAHQLRALVDRRSPDVERIVLVLDKLHTYARLPLRGLPARRGEALGGQAGAPRYAQARLLAHHRPECTQRAQSPGPRPTYPGQSHAAGGGHHVGRRPHPVASLSTASRGMRSAFGIDRRSNHDAWIRPDEWNSLSAAGKGPLRSRNGECRGEDTQNARGATPHRARSFLGNAEPMAGFEPAASCLRNSCSTTELHRPVIYSRHAA